MARSRPKHSTAKYRQLDDSITLNIPAPVNANITSITLDPLDSLWVYVWFDQPVNLSQGALEVPDWTINGLSFGGAQSFSSDYRVLHLKMAGTINIGDDYDFETTGANGGYQPINGGVINTGTGLVTEQPSLGTFAVLSAAAYDPGTIQLTFNSPVAVTSEAFSDDLDAITCSGIPCAGMSYFQNARQARIGCSSVTSGMTYDIPADTNYFVSLTGATLAASSGTLSPSPVP